MSIIEIIEKERLELAKNDDCDTKQYMSNEFFMKSFLIRFIGIKMV